MADQTQDAAKQPPPKEPDFRAFDDGVDLTLCFSGNWRRAVIALTWLFLFALIPVGFCVTVWIVQHAVNLMPSAPMEAFLEVLEALL